MRALVLLTVLAGAARAQPVIGDAAPRLDAPIVVGGSGTLGAAALRGHVSAVDFFATWCAPCQQALAVLDGLARAEPRLQVIIVDEAEDEATVRAFFAARPLPPNVRVVLDRDGALGRDWGQRRLPTTFLLDAGGVIRHINRGYGAGYPDRVGAWLRGLLR